ncbi:hypothetical protein SCLCIDRAFT_1212930 [Scleroderma citrinum Foug A]|uniref:Uncharacterized protein n=1 Tax=Scleroderma citrinum Foug A TaxID=1036808 RepID=A0A0C3EA16_9AGAM|nr:hypothetical protein SCLCIDRAFT_1212930 [Scleroderma citrinum Foug A]
MEYLLAPDERMSEDAAVEATPVVHKLRLCRDGTSSSPRCVLTCTKEDSYRGQRFILDAGIIESVRITRQLIPLGVSLARPTHTTIPDMVAASGPGREPYMTSYE